MSGCSCTSASRSSGSTRSTSVSPSSRSRASSDVRARMAGVPYEVLSSVPGKRSASDRTSSQPGIALPLRLVEVEHGKKGLLRHLHPADLLHPLLALLLLLEQLALAADVAPVAFREHVLPLRLHGLAGDHPRADRRLDRDVEHLPRDLLSQPLDEEPPPLVRRVAVQDQRERIHLLAADEHV